MTYKCPLLRSICLLILSIALPTQLFAFGYDSTSYDPNDWFYIKTKPREVPIFQGKRVEKGQVVMQTAYVFKSSKDNYCRNDKCPYAHPIWDDKIESVNKVLSHIGLPNIKRLIHADNWQYTDPDYPLGEIIIFKGKYYNHLWKVILYQRIK